MTGPQVPAPRSYRMRARADAAEQTRLRIIGAAIELAFEKPVAAITLPVIAERARVSVQTVLRQFGSREALIDEAAESGRAAVRAERPADPDDIEGSLDALIEHYEARGDGALLLLGQEGWDRIAADLTREGKLLHRDWATRTFARTLDALPDSRRVETLDLLVVATDVYAWKLLRRDRALTRGDTASRMRMLVEAIISTASAEIQE
ncbi:TetR/AcrR family transcriptional regulator [Microbacterium sp. P5_E9]